jgi:integrase
MLYNTGARVSEIIGVRVVDVVLDGAACVHLQGKGRKLRSVPLWACTVVEIRAWLRLNPILRGEAALLPNRDGQAMCRSNVAQRLNLAVARAAVRRTRPGLKKRVSPHTLRHTTAMHLLQSGVPFNVIALWLGHESTTTTHRYVEADLAMKEKALARLEAPDTKIRRYQGAGFAHAFPENAVTMRTTRRAECRIAAGPVAGNLEAPVHSRDMCIGVAGHRQQRVGSGQPT